LGFSDDQRLADGNFGNGAVLSGRSDDTGTGIASHNRTDPSNTTPLYMDEGLPGGDAKFLVIAPAGAEPAATFNASPSPPWALGHRIPGFALKAPSGSLIDIKAQGSLSAGNWTVMFTRRLKTATTTE
jgi:hypothetical protein